METLLLSTHSLSHKYPDGRLSDIFGRQSVLLFATFTFFIGSAACGAASNLWWLVAARAIAGIGGGMYSYVTQFTFKFCACLIPFNIIGGLNTMAAIIMSDIVSLRERGKFQGLGNLVFAVCFFFLFHFLLVFYQIPKAK